MASALATAVAPSPCIFISRNLIASIEAARPFRGRAGRGTSPWRKNSDSPQLLPTCAHVPLRFPARTTSGQILFRWRSTLAFELLAQLIGPLLQIFLQLLLLCLEHLGVRGRTFIGFLEAIA
jgi:hypothetical protein